MRMKRFPPFHLLPLWAFLLTTLESDAQASIVVDDSFDNGSADYSGFIISTLDPLNYSNYDFYDSPGGDSLIAEHIHDVERDEFTNEPVPFAPETPDIQTLFLFNSTSYTPSISGVIDTVDFKIDYRTFDPFSDLSFFIQNGSGSGAISGFTTPNNDGDWHTLEVVGLTTADFPGIDFSGASPLKFGFSFYSSAYVDPFGTDPVTYQVEVDNLLVTVNAVPEPSTSLILIAGVAPLLLKRRRSAA